MNKISLEQIDSHDEWLIQNIGWINPDDIFIDKKKSIFYQWKLSIFNVRLLFELSR